MKYKILIVDDEPANLRLLERLFRRSYQVITATSGPEALTLMELHDFALIISDQRMPEMTGIEFLKRASEMRPKTVRIILTGYTDVNDLVDAINSGVVYKYITKPWVNEELQLTVVRGLEYYETFKDRHDLIEQNVRLRNELTATTKGFVNFICETLRMHDASIHEKCGRIADHVRAVGHWLDLEVESMEQLELAVMLCEIGRLGIPDANAHADRAESSAFWAAKLENIPGMHEVASAIRFQHSHFDGNGPFEHLSGEQLPLYARMLAITSAFDSWMFPEGGQGASTKEEAFLKLRSEAGTRFDPNLVEAFCVASAVGPISSELAADNAIKYSLRERA
jgi:response regulator RpfG family c-di-GMP phosphodiesterase